jgi:hypothetical protein
MSFCTFCQEPISSDQVTLRCGHSFHKQCLCAYHDYIHRYEDPFSSSINITGCPNCRAQHDLKNICGDKEYYYPCTVKNSSNCTVQFGKKRKSRGSKKEPSILDLTDKKSILKLRREIIAQIKKKNTWVYFISKPVTDPKKVCYTLRSKIIKKINKQPGREFKKYVSKSRGDVTSFYSPRKTLLVIPRKGYINIADFAKRCTQREWIRLWRRTLKESKKMKKPFYILTHGHGVNWLHIRLQRTNPYKFRK